MTDSTGTAVLEGAVTESKDTIVTPVENVDSLVDQLDGGDIAEDVIPEAAPVAVQLRGAAGPDEVKWDTQQEEDDWSDIGWS